MSYLDQKKRNPGHSKNYNYLLNYMEFEARNKATSGIFEKLRQECEDEIKKINKKMEGMDEKSLEYAKQKNFLKIFQKKLKENSVPTSEVKRGSQENPEDNKNGFKTNEFRMR